MGIAIFDFDGTLFRGDSLIAFARYAIGGRRTFVALLRALPAIVRWKTGRITNSEAKQRLFSLFYRGTDYAALCRKGEEFARIVDGKLRPEVYAAMRKHIEAGDRVIIATASMPFWIRPWAEKEGIKEIIGTMPEIAAGKITGRFATANCYGEEKLRRVKELMATATGDTHQEEIHVYTDSRSDTPILSLATHPHLV